MDNSKLRQSKDNFYKKVSSSKGFTHQVQPKAEIYQTLIQMLKSDLLLVQDMIVSNSSDIKMYKILSKNPNLVRKLSEIEENPDIKPIIKLSAVKTCLISALDAPIDLNTPISFVLSKTEI